MDQILTDNLKELTNEFFLKKNDIINIKSFPDVMVNSFEV